MFYTYDIQRILGGGKVLYSIAYLFVLLLTVVHCRSAFEPTTNNLDRDSSSLLSQTLSLSRSKRAIFDSSCKGIYDRDLFAKLDRFKFIALSFYL
ncbi:hypothetical protein Avbf_19001 [Armadillidium vulgare]|nr:hypothetical protein Avbf_19001 [Armadillidium vulgare]